MNENGLLQGFQLLLDYQNSVIKISDDILELAKSLQGFIENSEYRPAYNGSLLDVIGGVSEPVTSKIIANICTVDRVYKSRVARWYIWFCICMTIALVGMIYLCYKSTWILMIDIVMMGICLLMIYDMLLHTDYTIRGENLHIRCGFLYRMDLPISKITEITHKSTILSSPALSAKRIGLRYGRTKWVYVSPKDQQEFISALKSINREIKIN